MPLDPDLKKVLEQIEAAGKIDLEKVSPQEYRQLMDTANLAMKNEVIDIPEVRNLQIPVDGGSIAARMYRPSEESRTLIVYYHGGGFVFGNIDTHDSVCRLISKESGSCVLSVDYRLAPEHKFPTAVNDSYSAYIWVLENSGKLGIDPERIAVCGDSAGGNISAVVSVRARDAGNHIPRLQALIYPVLGVDVSSVSHREFSEGFLLTEESSRWFMKQYLRDPSDFMHPFFSVQTADSLSGLPETMVFTAEFDSLRDQGETFVSKLRAQGVTATGVRALGMMHGFVSLFEFSPAARDFLIMVSKLVGEKLRRSP